MLPIRPFRSSRRALLQLAAGSAATLLAGCGGSRSFDETLPEGYAGAFRLNLTETEGESAYARAVTVTPMGDFLVAVDTRLYNGDTDTFSYGFHVSRYTRRAQPGLTERSDLFIPRTFSEETFGTVITDAAGRFYIPSLFVNGSPAPQAVEKAPAPLTIFAPDGTQEGTITFESVADYRIDGDSVARPAFVSVSPSGDYYATATLETPTDASRGASVLRWNRSGAFVAGYAGKEGFLDNGGGVAFLPDGIAVMPVFNTFTQTSGVLPLSEEGFGEFVPSSAGAVGHTDAAGNRYTVSTDYTRSRAATRDQPTPRKENILKYSPTGTQLALIRLDSDEYARTFIAVDTDGTIFAASGSEIIVCRRTR